MRVFVLSFWDDPHQAENPYVYTLIDAISCKHKEVEFGTQKQIFWSKEIFTYDIIHIMWPDALVRGNQHSLEELQNQLIELKSANKMIVCTCHNLHSHCIWSKVDVEAYEIVYQFANVFIHLGKYSQQILQQKYPSAQHVYIPHHVYNTVYTSFPTKEDALEKVGLPNHRYAICLGAFRSMEEKGVFFKIADGFKKFNVYCIAPSLMLDIPHGKINKRWIKQRIKWVVFKLRHPNAIINLGYVSNELIPFYFALSDFSIIQRLDILNSGNVPLGMYFGNVVLGPNVGNVNEILKETGNPRFDVNDLSTVEKACGDAMMALKIAIGEQNREFAIKNWSTEDVSEEVYQLYKSLI